MKKSKKVEKISKQNQRNLVIFLIVLFIFFILLIIRLVFLQFIDGSFLKSQANNQQTTTRIISANRGTIFDTNGKILAVSAEVDVVSVNPSNILYYDNTEVPKEILAQKFSELFKLDYAKTLEKLNEKTSYVEIADKVENDTVEALQTWMKEMKITSGININSTINRYYPYSNSASNLIGFTGTDTHGRIGLEYSLDDILAGTDGKVVTLTDSINGEIPNQEQSYIDAKNGSDIYLTINAKIQTCCEKYLAQAVKDNSADGGTAIVMEPSTGNILAMVTCPDYNLNEPFTPTNSDILAKWDTLEYSEKNNLLYEMWNNSAVQSTYEPGSTFKLITAATALEEGIVGANDPNVFYCDGSQEVGSIKINCWKDYDPHYYQSLKEALANSCNPAFIQLGQKIGAETLYKYYKAFGLFETTNSVFYGESNSIFFDTVNEYNLATMSFGQRFTITPLQLITAVSAIANEGVLVQPQIVKKIVDTNTGAITETKINEIRQVISKETAETMMAMLEYVVTDGTGSYAKIAGYSVGGKSGTSEPLYSDDESGYTASFIGVSPTTNAEVVVLVIVYNPKAGNYQGGVTCGPVVAQILTEILPELEVAGDNVTSSSSITNDYSTTVLPNVTNMSISSAKEALANAGFSVTISGNEDSSTLIIDQNPKSGTSLLDGANIFLYTQNNNIRVSTTVPNFKGMSASQAINSANSKDLNLILNGEGIVISQDTTSGTTIESGSVVTLTLQPELNGGY